MRVEVLLVVLALCGYTLGARGIRSSCSSNVKRSDRTILDIKKSVSLGAKLLVGTWAESQDSCLSRCCGKANCDMALFKTDGVSAKGNNCYLVHCGSLNNCRMVPLGSFNTFFFKARSGQSESRTGDPSHTLDSLTEHSERKGHDRGISMATTGPAHLVTPLPSELPQTSAKVKSTSTTTSSVPSSSRMSNDKTTTAASPSKDDHKSPTQGKQEEADSTQPLVDTSKNVNKQDQDNKEPDSPVSKNKVCGAYGCDGSGIVAVVVVAAICVAIIIVVGAILLKKVVDERRRKKFRNVDYLINGMYT